MTAACRPRSRRQPTAAETARADDLLDQVKALRNKSLSLMLAAEKSGDLRTALAGIREARACLELLAELSQAIDRRPDAQPADSPRVARCALHAARSAAALPRGPDVPWRRP